MEYIQEIKTLYYKDNVVGSDSRRFFDDVIPEETKEEITWNTLQKIPIFIPGFNVIETARGRIILLGHNLFPIKIKEWGSKDPNLTLITTYRSIKPSLEDIYKYHDVNKSMMYLKGRNLA